MRRGFSSGTLFRTLLVLCLAAALAVPAVAHAVLSGTNGRILFASGRGGPDGNDSQAKLYLRTTIGSVGGGSTGQALTPQAGQHRHPTWAPDRTMIAYARGPANCNPDCDIFILDLTQQNATPDNITNSPNVNEDRPAWSPDGTRIAFARGGDQDDGLPFHIHTVTLASGKTTQVTSGRVQDLLPAWQPQ